MSVISAVDRVVAARVQQAQRKAGPGLELTGGRARSKQAVLVEDAIKRVATYVPTEVGRHLFGDSV